MRKIKPGILLGVIILLLGVTVQAASGDSAVSDQVVVILADRQMIGESEETINLAKSLVGLVSVLREGQTFFFTTLDDPTDTLGPAIAGDLEFRSFQEQIDAKLASTGTSGDPDLVTALARTYNQFSGERAGTRSTAYLLTGGGGAADRLPPIDHVTTLVGLFNDSGWPIFGLALPGTSPDVQQLLTEISTDSGGEYIELGIPSGFKVLADKILADEAQGSLAEVGQVVLSAGDVLTNTISIAPGTSEATLLFFKEGPFGSLRLSNPEGFEASAGDRAFSSVMETPNVVVWKLTDPAPGHWKVEARGIEGVISAWHFLANKYGLVLESFSTVPLDQPSSLVAYVTDGRRKVTLEGVSMAARVITPDGTTLAHVLHDDGISGDVAAGDGYFSATIPPLRVQGEHKVELELSWPDLDHSISSQAAFMAQAFPSIQLALEHTEDLQPGERSKVATAIVNVNGQPYAISTDEVASALASNSEQPGVLEVTPQVLLDEGRAWLYDVFFTPNDEGLHTLMLQLTTTYAGRPYTFATDSVVLSSMSSSLPVELAVPVAAAVTPPTPPTPVRMPLSQPSRFPWGLLITAIAVASILIAAAIYWRTRTRPYGYLYNDRDELILDFSSLSRQPIFNFLFRNLVRGRELSVPGLEGMSFKFSRHDVDLQSSQVARTVRVNNQPLLGKTKVCDRAWIGTHGRLYSFARSPQFPQMQPGVGDG